MKIQQYQNNNESSKSIIGLLGGAGPEACIDVQLKLIKVMQNKLNIIRDQDYIRVIVDNNTNLKNREFQFFNGGSNSIIDQYTKTLAFFESLGVNVAAVTCNSAHLYFDKLQSLTSIKLVHIIHTVAKNLQKLKINQVGLLCTLSMYESKFYQKILNEYDINVIIPSRVNQICVAQVIYSIKSGLFPLHTKLSLKQFKNLETVYVNNLAPTISSQELSSLKNISPDILLANVINELVTKQVDNIILGCTELPLIYGWYKYIDLKFIDVNLLLANELLEKAIAGRTKL